MTHQSPTNITAITLPEYGHLLPTLAFLIHQKADSSTHHTFLIPTGSTQHCTTLQKKYYPQLSVTFKEIPNAPYFPPNTRSRYTVYSPYESTLAFARAAKEHLRTNTSQSTTLVIDSALEFLLDDVILKNHPNTIIFHAVLPLSIKILRQGKIRYTHLLGPVLRWPKIFVKAIRLFWRVNHKKRYKISLFRANRKFSLHRYIFTEQKLLTVIPAIEKMQLTVLPQQPERIEDIPETLKDFLQKNNAVTYLSLGTIFEPAEEHYHKLIEKVIKDKPLVIACSPSMQITLRNRYKNRPNTYIGSGLPQRSILRHADHFITHGGFNSLNEAIRAHVPMTFVPAMFEQELNAYIAEKLGFGTVARR